ncbi:sensor histidine kinase [Crystallibacter degradans]|uniref:sensor histidine kinase n=1 Tax=Crystallibacter degradans TaxID=2726743 RepID=UPI001472D2B0|nr:ATP-binding protein [Arthrobacter sp. SF27]NMR30395.1 PAS domain-containing protein [Arthrobacter sp. SF27]
MSAVVKNALAMIGVRKQFHELNLRYRVFLSQMPLVISVTLVALVAAIFFPTTLDNVAFQAGLIMLAVLTAASFLVPWDRLPYPTYWVIPLLDFVVVAALRTGGAESLSGLSMLAVFPVFWLAWSGIAPVAARIISFFAPLLLVWVPVLTSGEPVTAAGLADPFLIPIIMLAICVTASIFSLSETDKQEVLEAKDRELQAVLDETRDRSRLMQTMMDTVGVGLVAVDKDGHDILMNRRQQQNHMLAAPPGNTDPNERQLHVYKPDRTSPIPPEERPVLRAVRGETFSDELVWIGEGKQQRAMSISARSMRDDDGTFAGSVVAFSDVTDLVNALAAKDDFVASVSHELRTPLTSIIGYLDLSLEETQLKDPDGSLAVSLRVALRNAERLLQLVSDLLTTASGPAKIEQRNADLAEVIASCLASATPRAEEAGVVLVNESPSDLEAFIDHDRMCQVMDNLLSNAIKYSPAGGRVTVRAWQAEGRVGFEVEDHGMGIAEEDLGGVFTKFFRTPTVRRAAIPGVGLGLVITKAIVEAHGGSISFTSKLGKGTTFTVLLPADGGDRTPSTETTSADRV